MTTITSILADRSLSVRIGLSRSIADENRSLTRLASLRRINHGSDDPAGMIAASELESELTAIETAERNALSAEKLLAVADSGMSQVGDLLNTIESSALAAAGDSASAAEKQAYQQQIDAALEAIDRIGATTQFSGRNLLDGSASELSFAIFADPADAVSISLPRISAASLGGADGMLSDLASGGIASVASGRASAALAIVRQARSRLHGARAEVGAFQRLTLESNREVLSSSTVELNSAISAIRDTDVAVETSRLIRSQILTRAALASIRNSDNLARIQVALLGRLD
jgi:flagellin